MTFYVRQGDIFEAGVDVLVNPVNTLGVMGAGMAKEVKQRYPESIGLYKDVCAQGILGIGQCVLGKTVCDYPMWVIHFPTRKHWKHPSRYKYIEMGLGSLVEGLLGFDGMVQSVAIPALGCGLGGLEVSSVLDMTREAFKHIVCLDVYFYRGP